MVAGGVIGTTAAIFRWADMGENNVESATIASILPALLNDLILILISIFGLIYLLLVHQLTKIQVIGFSSILLILGLAVGGVTLGLHFRDQTVSVFIWVSRQSNKIRRKPFNQVPIIESTKHIFTAWDDFRKRDWQKPVLGEVLNVVFDMLTLYLLFVASGKFLSPGILLAGYGLPLLFGKMAFIVPGGVGVVESSMAAIYDGLGIPDGNAVVVVLGYRLISFWLPSFAGFPVAAYLQSNREKRNEKSK